MDDKTIRVFINGLINSIYKILPLKESDDVNLDEYLDSVYVQLLGGLESFPSLKENLKYISVINIIQYFKSNDYPLKTCKREVLKCTNILEKLNKQED